MHDFTGSDSTLFDLRLLLYTIRVVRILKFTSQNFIEGFFFCQEGGHAWLELMEHRSEEQQVYIPQIALIRLESEAWHWEVDAHDYDEPIHWDDEEDTSGVRTALISESSRKGFYIECKQCHVHEEEVHRVLKSTPTRDRQDCQNTISGKNCFQPA